MAWIAQEPTKVWPVCLYNTPASLCMHSTRASFHVAIDPFTQLRLQFFSRNSK